MMSDGAPFTIDEAPPAPRRSTWEIITEAALAVPHLLELLVRLMSDGRVPVRRKVLVGAAALYMASPIDLVPELLLPVIGQLDDLLIVVFSIHYLLRSADDEMMAEYWRGSQDSLELVSALLEWGSELLPRPVRKALER